MRRPMSSEDVRTAFENAGCIVRDGHFVYASGKHGDTYLNKDIVLSDPRRAEHFGESIAIKLEEALSGRPIEAVVGAAMSGIKMSHLVANHLWKPERPVISIYAEDGDPHRGEDPSQLYLHRGFELAVRGRTVVVAEDIVNRASTSTRLMQLITAAGGEVVAIGAIWNRGSITALMQPNARHKLVPIVSLHDEELAAWTRVDCPLCAQNVPISTLGHGPNFLKKRDPV
ncbi:MAG: hypothetical protein QY323_04395 [Patescibacteria group bacterium]|nr:MAG: hypothetical protein QY323_04395 [Patescibacteria group bacterium]